MSLPLKGLPVCYKLGWNGMWSNYLYFIHMQAVPVKTRTRHVAGDRAKVRTRRALCISLGSLDLIYRQWRPWKALNKEAMGTNLILNLLFSVKMKPQRRAIVEELLEKPL